MELSGLHDTAYGFCHKTRKGTLEDEKERKMKLTQHDKTRLMFFNQSERAQLSIHVYFNDKYYDGKREYPREWTQFILIPVLFFSDFFAHSTIIAGNAIYQRHMNQFLTPAVGSS